MNSPDGRVENIPEIPAEIDRFVQGCWLFLVEERRVSQLLHQAAGTADVLVANRLGKVGDDRQYIAGIELRGMRGESNPRPELSQQGEQRVLQLVDRYSAGQTFQFVALHGVMNLLESGVFQRVHEHDLAFHVLDDLEKKGKLVVFSKIRTLAGEKITDNLNRVRAGGEPFAAGFFQQWEQDAGLLYGIKRAK